MIHLSKEQAGALNQAASRAGDDVRSVFEALTEAWNRAVEKAEWPIRPPGKGRE